MKFEQIKLKSEMADWRNLHEDLKKELKEQAGKLRERGFSIDDECRVDPMAFRKAFGKDVEMDMHRVERLEERQKNQEATKSSDEKQQELKGEILEMNKTLAFNENWFGKRLIAVRTSKYDDFDNHVDQLILDSKTGQPFAAIDTTTDWKSKRNSPDFYKRIQKGCRVKYGFKLDEKKQVQLASYEHLPLFIVSVPAEESSSFQRDTFLGNEKRILESFKKQQEQFSAIAGREAGEGYQKAAKIFEELES